MVRNRNTLHDPCVLQSWQISCVSSHSLVCSTPNVTQGVTIVTTSLRTRGTSDGEAYVVRGFNVSAFFEVIAEVAAARNTNWKALAKELGVSPSTLSRRGRGRCPDAATLAALSAWAGLNPADFVVASNNGRA